MPQLEPIYYLSTIKGIILGIIVLKYIYSKIILPRGIERDRIRVRITKAHAINKELIY